MLSQHSLLCLRWNENKIYWCCLLNSFSSQRLGRSKIQLHLERDQVICWGTCCGSQLSTTIEISLNFFPTFFVFTYRHWLCYRYRASSFKLFCPRQERVPLSHRGHLHPTNWCVQLRTLTLIRENNFSMLLETKEKKLTEGTTFKLLCVLQDLHYC